MINSVQNAYQTQAVSTVKYIREQEQIQQEKQQSGDKVSISDSANIMSKVDSFFSQLNIPYTPEKAITLDDMKTGLEKSSREFQDKVNIMFLENGIKTDPPVELTYDKGGNVVVKGNHPQKEKIEKLFEENPELANDFRGVSALSGMVEAAEEHIEFAKAYEKNPYEAVARYGHLFNGMKGDNFSMVIGLGKKDKANT